MRKRKILRRVYTPERIAKEREVIAHEIRHPDKYPHSSLSYSGWSAALDEIERLQTEARDSTRWILSLIEDSEIYDLEIAKLKRANEKYRRKLAKRRAQQLRRQYSPEFGFGDFSSWYNMWHSLQLRWRTSTMRLQLRFEFKNERQRNPGLRKFLTWQDAFTFTLGAEAPALELKAELKP